VLNLSYIVRVTSIFFSQAFSSHKQSKKVRKYAKETQDMQAQMFQWHSLMKTILPNLSPPKSMLDSLSESEDGEDDDDDDDDCGGGVEK